MGTKKLFFSWPNVENTFTCLTITFNRLKLRNSVVNIRKIIKFSGIFQELVGVEEDLVACSRRGAALVA